MRRFEPGTSDVTSPQSPLHPSHGPLCILVENYPGIDSNKTLGMLKNTAQFTSSVAFLNHLTIHEETVDKNNISSMDHMTTC
jgi:hypothetical protein